MIKLLFQCFFSRVLYIALPILFLTINPGPLYAEEFGILSFTEPTKQKGLLSFRDSNEEKARPGGSQGQNTTPGSSKEPGKSSARKSIHVSFSTIVIYILYLCTIWAVVFSMAFYLKKIPENRKPAAKHIYLANLLLAAGDSAMFIGWAVAYSSANPGVPTSELLQIKIYTLLLFGVFSTSATMSCYYLLVGYYYRDKFALGEINIFIRIILFFFIVRILLHYNPDNIWFSAMLPAGTPNPSAWLRNIPLYAYGLLAVGLCLTFSFKQLKTKPEDKQRKELIGVVIAMLALIISFVFYGLDVFFAHKIPKSFIWITYTVKTIAYVVALFAFWYSEFYSPSNTKLHQGAPI